MSSILHSVSNAINKAGQKIDDAAHNLLDPQHVGLNTANRPPMTAEQGRQ